MHRSTLLAGCLALFVGVAVGYQIRGAIRTDRTTPIPPAPTTPPIKDDERVSNGPGQPTDSLSRRLALSLEVHPELLLAPAVMGGTMRWVPSEFQVLTRRWVLAGFEDGHVHGWALLAYDQTDAAVKWRLLESYVE